MVMEKLNKVSLLDFLRINSTLLFSIAFLPTDETLPTTLDVSAFSLSLFERASANG
jgi:hypothetical protein